MLVYIHSNYNYPNLLRQTPQNTGKWNDIQFTYDEVKEADYIVVLNHPTKDINVKCRKGGRILIIQEPPYERNSYLIPYFSYFDKIVCAFDKKHSPTIYHIPAALPWLIDKSYDQLRRLSASDIIKEDAISWVTSNSNMNPGHEPRLNFLEKIKESQLNVALFGRGIKSIENKFDGIAPYKYTLAVENYSDTDYWTEKISDAFLSWTMPFYFGCKNIGKYFPENSFVKIDINQPEMSIELIQKCIKDRVFDKNILAIKQARELVLERYQFFPFFCSLIDQDITNRDYVNYFIPANPSQINFFEKLKLACKF